MDELTARVEIARDVAKMAGDFLMKNFGKNLEVSRKEDGSLVSEADIQVEKITIPEIKRNFPQDNILTEETPEINGGGDYLWIIDPLDGTHNYVKGINIFGSSFAICRNGEVLGGAISLPFNGEIYWATKGQGAFVNDRKINVSNRVISQATMIFDSSIGKSPERTLPVLEKLSKKVFNIRMFGSSVAGLCRIASGSADFEVEFFDKVWDFAMGLLLIEEAGGKATTLDGGKWNLSMIGYIASNTSLHEEILRTIKSE